MSDKRQMRISWTNCQPPTSFLTPPRPQGKFPNTHAANINYLLPVLACYYQLPSKPHHIHTYRINDETKRADVKPRPSLTSWGQTLKHKSMKSNPVVKSIPQDCHTAVWSTEVMAVTGENQVNARMTCSGSTLNATNLREQTGDRITLRRRRLTLRSVELTCWTRVTTSQRTQSFSGIKTNR